MRFVSLILFIFTTQGYTAYAQQPAPGPLTGVYVDSLQVTPGDTLQLRPFVIKGTESVQLNSVILSREQYQLDDRYGRLVLTDSLATGLVVVQYRTLPFAFDPFYQLNEPVRIEQMPDTANFFTAIDEQARREERTVRDPFGDSRVQRSGSISRGIVAGNNRDVTVESGLRMQLAGEIVDGVNVQAVLTDENTPIQPEGTTQRLNEFDRVFIEVAARQGTVQLGDFDVQYQNAEFAQFSRKLQGVHLFGDVPSLRSNDPVLSIDVAGATSRGIFRSQSIVPIDGVQGPYRLEGENGEQFLIIVAGSEVVYLDGVQMTRGENNDYTVDYATGEVTFTPNRIITEDRRIVVEFQYTTNEFSRTLTGASVTTNLWPDRRGDARSSFGITFVREADGDLFNEEFGFTATDSLRIIGAGDGLAQRSGAERVVFDPEAPYVQYTLDLIPQADGRVDSIFVAVDAVPSDTMEVFRVRFTRLGTGQGSYVRLGRGVNGLLYEYRGPGQGDYEPVRILPKPANHNVLDFNGRLEPIRGIELFGEWARSFNDQNRLSSLDRNDDIDHAYKAGFRVKPIPINFGFAENGHVEAEVRRRQVGSDFESFNRIRPVEFGRRWNIGSQSANTITSANALGDERIDEAQAAIYLNPVSFVRAERGSIDLGNAFSGTRSMVEAEFDQRARYQTEWIDSKDLQEEETGRWVRQSGRLTWPLFEQRLAPSIEFEQEQREQRVTGTDSLTRASLAFTELRPGITWKADRLDAGVSVAFRSEDDWAEGKLLDAASAQTYQTRFSYQPGTSFNTEGSVGYRVRRFTEYFQVNQQRKNNESVLLRWNTQWRPFRRAIDITSRYEASTERTPTLQEIYIRTGPELGQFVWEDTNSDGIIQLDEFLPERTPNEGSYVKTFVPSDSLSSIISVRALLRLQLEPSRVWGGDSEGLKKILRQVSSRTTIEIQEKSREDQLADIYLLKLDRFRSPENTLNGRLRLAQDLLLFRMMPNVGVDLRFNQLRNLSELSAGEETRFLNTWSAEARYAPSKSWGLKLNGALERNRVNSEAFASRRYNIEGLRLEPEISFNPSSAISLSGGATWAQKTDAIGNRSATVIRLPFELRYNRVRKAQITTRFETAFVSLTGDAVGLAAFELTDGRGAGTSYLWGISGDYTLNDYLRLSLAYDGRAPADAPVLNTVRLQMSAIF